MKPTQQLKLVTATPVQQPTTDPTRVVFDHWVYMFGRHPGRTKMDAERRMAINAALALYGLEDVLLAVEGMSAVPLGDKPESMRDAMREITWFLASARRVEQCLAHGDRLRHAAASAATALQAARPEAPADPVAAAAARERLRDLAQRFRQCNG